MRSFVSFVFVVACGAALCSALPLLSSSWPGLSSYPTDLEASSSAPSLLLRLLSSSHGLFTPRMVQTSQSSEPYWTSEIGKHILRLRGVSFFDVTIDAQKGQLVSTAVTKGEPVFPTKMSYAKKLDLVYEEVSDEGPRTNLAKFTSFRNRYYKSETGRSSQLWLLEKVKEVSSAELRRIQIALRPVLTPKCNMTSTFPDCFCQQGHHCQGVPSRVGPEQHHSSRPGEQQLIELFLVGCWSYHPRCSSRLDPSAVLFAGTWCR